MHYHHCNHETRGADMNGKSWTGRMARHAHLTGADLPSTATTSAGVPPGQLPTPLPTISLTVLPGSGSEEMYIRI